MICLLLFIISRTPYKFYKYVKRQESITGNVISYSKQSSNKVLFYIFIQCLYCDLICSNTNQSVASTVNPWKDLAIIAKFSHN